MLSQEDNDLMCRVGPETPGGQWLRRFWVPFLQDSKLPGPDCDPVEVRLLGEDLVAFRDTNGKVGLLEANCPHRLAPLFYGRNEDCGLRCIYHGWKFDVDGNCVDMPAEPADSTFKDRLKAVSYPTCEMGGIVWAYMGPPEHVPDMPALEFLRVPESHRLVKTYRHHSNWVQSLEGDADSSHIGYLHGNAPTVSADVKDPYAKTVSTVETRFVYDGNPPKWFVEPTDYGMIMAARRDADPDSYYWRVSQWLLPFYTFIPGPLDQSRGHCHIWVPVDDYWTDTFDIIWSPQPANPLSAEAIEGMTGGPAPHIATLDPETGLMRASAENHFFLDRHVQRTETYSGIAGVREQDTAVTSGMGPLVDRTKEHLATTDVAIIALRRVLIEGIRALAQKGEEPYAARHAESLRVRSWSQVLPRREDFINDPAVKRLTASLITDGLFAAVT